MESKTASTVASTSTSIVVTKNPVITGKVWIVVRASDLTRNGSCRWPVVFNKYTGV